MDKLWLPVSQWISASPEVSTFFPSSSSSRLRFTDNHKNMRRQERQDEKYWTDQDSDGPRCDGACWIRGHLRTALLLCCKKTLDARENFLLNVIGCYFCIFT